MRIIILAVLVSVLLVSSAEAVEISPVTIYGKIIMSLDYADNGDDGYVGITSSNSRLGFRGNFTLTENYKAIWQIESRVRFDLSGDDFATRNTFVGFTSKYGSLLFGRHDSPYKLTNNRTDAFLNRFGDNRNLIGSTGGGFDLRVNRMVMYESPPDYKAGYKILYKTESGQQGTDLLSASAAYEADEWRVWAAGEVHGKMITAVNDSTPSEANEYGLRAAAVWRIESWSFFTLLEGIGNFLGYDDVHKYSWVLGGRYYLRGRWNLRAKYVGTTGRSDVDYSAGNMFAGSVDYVLSESALFFLAGSFTLNQDNARFNTVNSGLFWTFLPVQGQTVWGFSLGTILAF